jgi:tetratricopeptide (TPR) repeat protein
VKPRRDRRTPVAAGVSEASLCIPYPQPLRQATPHWVKLDLSKANHLFRHAFAICLLAALPVCGRSAETGQLDASPSLFTVMAAINAAGYRADWSSPNNHPVRFEVQKEIAKRNVPSIAALKEFFDAHHKKSDNLELSQYVSFALSCSGPPTFEMNMRDVEIPPDVAPLRDLSRLLTAFYKEANIESQWQRSQPAIEQYLARYHGPVTDAVLQVNGYLRQMTSGFKNRRFQIYIELQAAPNQIQTRSYSDNYTIVVTPSMDTRVFDIRHAYLHYLLDPQATRHQEIWNRKKSLVDHANRAKALGDAFKEDYLLLGTESLIKAIESRLDRRPGGIDEALKEGYILAPYFGEALAKYEKQETSMYLYYTEMIQAIDLGKEDRRLSEVNFNRESTERPLARVAQPVEAPLDPLAKTLADGEKAFTERNLAEAKQLFLRVLNESSKRSLHASAYYGLGRVALMEKHLDEAETLFEKSLASEPEPFDRAWDMVYLGKLILAMTEPDLAKATEYFQGVMSMEGATDKARQEAKLGLEQINKSKDNPKEH